MRLEDLAATLDLLRAKGVRKATIADGATLEVEFFGAAAPPTAETGEAGTADFVRELNERTEGYEVALKQVASRRFQKRGES